MLDESIETPATSDNSLSLRMLLSGIKLQVKFDGSCSKQEKTTFTHKTTVNVYIVYKMNLWSHKLGVDLHQENLYLELLNLLKILISTSILILDVVLDLMCVKVFHCLLVMGFVKTP